MRKPEHNLLLVIKPAK